ncbi:unnamed protein product, partial [Cladocopium goreaui]
HMEEKLGDDIIDLDLVDGTPTPAWPYHCIFLMPVHRSTDSEATPAEVLKDFCEDAAFLADRRRVLRIKAGLKESEKHKVPKFKFVVVDGHDMGEREAALCWSSVHYRLNPWKDHFEHEAWAEVEAGVVKSPGHERVEQLKQIIHGRLKAVHLGVQYADRKWQKDADKRTRDEQAPARAGACKKPRQRRDASNARLCDMDTISHPAHETVAAQFAQPCPDLETSPKPKASSNLEETPAQLAAKQQQLEDALQSEDEPVDRKTAFKDRKPLVAEMPEIPADMKATVDETLAKESQEEEASREIRKAQLALRQLQREALQEAEDPDRVYADAVAEEDETKSKRRALLQKAKSSTPESDKKRALKNKDKANKEEDKPEAVPANEPEQHVKQPRKKRKSQKDASEHAANEEKNKDDVDVAAPGPDTEPVIADKGPSVKGKKDVAKDKETTKPEADEVARQEQEAKQKKIFEARNANYNLLKDIDDLARIMPTLDQLGQSKLRTQLLLSRSVAASYYVANATDDTLDLLKLEKGIMLQANNAKSRGVSIAWNKHGGPDAASNAQWVGVLPPVDQKSGSQGSHLNINRWKMAKLAAGWEVPVTAGSVVDWKIGPRLHLVDFVVQSTPPDEWARVFSLADVNWEDVYVLDGFAGKGAISAYYGGVPSIAGVRKDRFDVLDGPTGDILDPPSPKRV